MNTSNRLGWGILGCGNIAGAFAKALPHSCTGRLVAVGSRASEKAEAFAAEHGGARGHGSYEALLADSEVQAVYIATPHPMHAEWIVRCAEAGKHILCEKPVTLNAWECMAVLEHVRRHDVFFMEAFMYRCHPQTRRLVELIRAGAVGDVRLIVAHFGFNAPFDEAGRIYNNDLGGGGILDVGCYPVSLSRLVASVALGTDVAEPSKVVGGGRLAPTGVDAVAAATLVFEGGIVAQVATAVEANLGNTAEIVGTKGRLVVESPWFCSGHEGGTSHLRLIPDEGEPETIAVTTDQWLYATEADVVAEYLDARQAPSPAMSWKDTIGNMTVLDAWRGEVGLRYGREQPERFQPVHGRSLRQDPVRPMPTGPWPAVDFPVSRLVMGADHQTDLRHAFVMWDAFFEAGGNAIDTARLYGPLEQHLGDWIRSRGLRDQIAIITKGGHPPDDNLEAIADNLRESLEALRVDRIDLYLLHRDNLDIDVGAFIDLLDEAVQDGRLGAIGASNWTPHRIDEANAYAKKHGKTGFTTVSNNFSLARMVAPIWDGCLAFAEDEDRKWLWRSGMNCLPWSSQARGFFVPDRATSPEDLREEELVRCWYSPENFQRKRRAAQFAADRGVSVINVALAYLLCHPHPIFPLIGPRTPRELSVCLESLKVTLSEEELSWLDNGD